MRKLKEAVLYEKKDKDTVSCNLCSHRCNIAESGFGICRVRQNIKGRLYTHVYGKLIAANIDPIEKKPIFHMLPGSKSYSIATIGCNFHCDFCQNWQISQAKLKDGYGAFEMTAEQVVKEAKTAACRSIAYTYTEPTIFFEFALDVMKLAKENNIYNIFITNGFMTAECLEMARPYLSAANVDLKAFSGNFYKKVCGARLEPVLDNIKLMHKMGIWVEITTLVIPGMNDSSAELKQIAGFIASLDKKIPWHISRFHPDYKITDLPATPLSKLNEAIDIAKAAGLSYVYLGNVLDEANTYCSGCGGLLLRRSGFAVLENKLKDAHCQKCGKIMDGIAL